MAVVDVSDLLLHPCFLGIIICLSVPPVVIVGIRAYPQPPQEPADAECKSPSIVGPSFFLMKTDNLLSMMTRILKRAKGQSLNT